MTADTTYRVMTEMKAALRSPATDRASPKVAVHHRPVPQDRQLPRDVVDVAHLGRPGDVGEVLEQPPAVR
ncbi:hypothetical protein [Cellulomonas wangsupingiae]|uniref:Uncharacterized protein n=1 Tax=Cellulomonas wangsupingiae TaxID=2968085 RepID=A0ABY5K6N9_9CELL|nr:hypothetical protein [Cellulomonas wangsupingiae]MCC2336385.1 hypothetical protein [Cellulomonas wangsupingiae]UUI65640.1 hypothetical protein NP075_02560 [Cellulomonas wangsupingiae]